MSTPTEPWTIRRLLEWTSGFFARKEVDSPRLSAELLLAYVLGLPRIKLYTNHTQVVDEKQLGAFRELVRRAAEQEPVAYLTGTAHFFNLELEVTRKVLIPRPDTETLVEQVIQLARHEPGLEAPRVLDLCTGSGCVAAAIARNLPSATVIATEISPAAVAVAQRNIERLSLTERITILPGDLFEPLSRLPDREPFDLIVANPPYIPSGQIERLDRSVRDYEPVEALDGGPDGLGPHRRILAESPPHLRGGGHIFLEIAFDQGEAARQLAEAHQAYEAVRILKDYAGHDRVVTARRRGS